MRMVTNISVSETVFNDQAFIIEHYKKLFNKEKDRLLQKKSLRVFNPVTRFYDQHADNFIRNLVTYQIKFDAFKVPRIIKRLISK